tara:strand:+ start:63 stop:965 length:903 start_codon:yes stop_codon:yes gene_type:complete
MTTLIEKIEEERPTLKDISVKSYANSIRNIILKYTNVDIKKNYKYSYLNYFINVKDFITFLENTNLSKSTQATYLYAVIVLLSFDEVNFKTELKEYKRIYKLKSDQLNNKPKTLHENKNWTTIKKLLLIQKQMEKNLNKNSYKDYKNFVIISLHLLQEPRRNIARTIRVLHEKVFDKMEIKNLDGNFLVLCNKPFFFYGDQKNSDRNGEVVMIDNNLKNILLDFIKTFNIKNNDLLLSSREGNNTIISTGAYSKILLKYLNVSSSMIRKIYITEKKKLSNAPITHMGNSTATQYICYYKP